MEYQDLIFGLNYKAVELGYFEQFIYGYDDRLNTSMNKDVNEEPNNYPILLVPPQNSTRDKNKVERFASYSISGHKRAKVQKNVTVTIGTGSAVSFNTTVFEAGDYITFRDSRTNHEMNMYVTVVSGGVAACTSIISLAVGELIVDIEENRSSIHQNLAEGLIDVAEALKTGFPNMKNETVRATVVDNSYNITRLDDYGSRGYLRVLLDFQLGITNCSL